MLAEERFSRILSIIEAEGSATIQELMTALDASESTVRRDLITMDENGLLTKVHGGAIARRPSVSTHDEDVRNRKTMNAEQKNAIAKYAASLIRPDDFVYLDAGTSTEAMIPFKASGGKGLPCLSAGRRIQIPDRGDRRGGSHGDAFQV